MTVALTGASGRLGHFVSSHLNELDTVARPLGREGGGLAATDFRPFLEGCQGLVHAAFAHVPGAYRGGEGDDPVGFWQLNHGGTLRLLEQARELGVQKVVLFSSRAVYGAHQQLGSTPIHEEVNTEPDTHYGLLKAATEDLARLYSDDRMQVTVLRPTGIYGGPARLNKWTPLFRDALQGRLPENNRLATEVHGQTVAEAVAMALHDRENHMAGQVYNLSELRISTAEILSLAGFDTTGMAEAAPFKGPELSSQALQRLGLSLRGEAALKDSVRDLKRELLTS